MGKRVVVNDPWNRLALWSGSGKVPYVISERNTDGALGCSCWPWRKNRTCKHLDAIKSVVARGGAYPRNLHVLNPDGLKKAVIVNLESGGLPESEYPGLAEMEAEMVG